MKKNRFVIAIVLIIFIFLGISIVQMMTQAVEISNSIYTLDYNWDVKINGVHQEDTENRKLQSIVFSNIKEGDVITLTRQFTEEDGDRKAIVFDVWHTIVNVYINDKNVYSWGKELDDNNKMLGNYRNIVYFEDSVIWKELKIELTATQDDPLPYVDKVAFYKPDNKYIMWFNRLPFFLAAGFVCFSIGFVIIVIAFLFSIKTLSVFEPLTLGVTVLLMGVYILARGKAWQLFIMDPVIYNSVEYLSIFSIPAFILFYWQKDSRECSKKWISVFYEICLAIDVIFVVASIAVNFTTRIYFSKVLPFFYAIVILTNIVIVLITINMNKESINFRKRLNLIAILWFVFGSLLSIISYKLLYTKVIAERIVIWKWYEYVLPMSMLIVVVILLIVIFLDVKKLVDNNYKNEIYRKIAYNDSLTKLYNRYKFTEDLENLISYDSYGIISIDLNGLKIVNDSFGHIEGDKMLTDFSKIMIEACEGRHSCYRIGGDEFIVIVKEDNNSLEDECDNIKKKILAKIEKYNENSSTFSMSVAIGIGLGRKYNIPEEILKLSDKQMYEDKRRFYKIDKI